MTNSKSGILTIDNSTKSVLVWSLIALVVVGSMIGTYFVDMDTYVWLGTEDEFGENMTAVFYFVAGILLVLHGRREMKDGSTLVKQSLPILLGLFFLFIAAEEISWGQRIIGFGTPESIQSINRQGEFTIHNLGFFNQEGGIIDAYRALHLFVLFQGILLPLAYRFWPFVRQTMNRMNFPVVPLACVGFFVLSMVHVQLSKYLISHYEISKGFHYVHMEVRELIFSIGFFVSAIAVYRETNRLE